LRVLLTTTSYQDTPGPHHAALAAAGFEVVAARGPLSGPQLLALIGQRGPFDATLNGDDHFTASVIDALLPSLRCICKYGIGLDSIDVAHATARKVPVLFTPGVNHTTVAEHTFGLMIMMAKQFWPQVRDVKAGRWTRITGRELAGKTLAVLGVGRVGREVIKRAVAFEMRCIGFDPYWDDAFAAQYGVKRCALAEQALSSADIVSLHMNLTDENRGLINARRIAGMRDGAIVINTARGALVNEADVAAACLSGKLGGYATDVLEVEPPAGPHVFQQVDNIVVTPHIGSRTVESVRRQAMRATLNLVNFLQGTPDFIQANKI
jgi:D-3-phosphoglycerate dehydrogenase